MQKIFLSVINNQNIFDEHLENLIKQTIPIKALINSLNFIENAHKKQMSNVNLSYILDNLLFNILTLAEKFPS